MGCIPNIDKNHLDKLYPKHKAFQTDGMIHIIIPDYSIPIGFTESKSDLLLRLDPGYPDIPPDMWWFSPSIKRIDSQPIPETQVYEQILARKWQRWSRHLNSGHWIPGTDSIESYLALVQQELELAKRKIAA